jgi:serine/threonine protein phosphatase PrpC
MIKYYLTKQYYSKREQMDLNLGEGSYIVAQIQQRSWEDEYQIKKIGNFRYYAVFDGHGGSHRLDSKHVAQFCKNYLHYAIGQALSIIDSSSEQTVKNIIVDVFGKFDRMMHNSGIKYGSTCTIVLVDDINDKIYQINLGDSRSILFTDRQIIAATTDHRPENEHRRILKQGGFVTYNRLNGVLAMSRSFGDFELKEYWDHPYDPFNGPLSTLPDIIITPKHLIKNFIISSDAAFERFSNQTIVDMIRQNSNVKDMVNKIKFTTTDDITMIYGTI